MTRERKDYLYREYGLIDEEPTPVEWVLLDRLSELNDRLADLNRTVGDLRVSQ
jgi:hypothetical protein